MRLLNTTNLTFKEFYDPNVAPYAILSHCWTHVIGSEEPTYQQALAGTYQCDSSGWRKVIECCRIARSRNLQWVWIDTVCIDKTSSAELSETINSMYLWYRDSAECFVFLDDVTNTSDFGANATHPTGFGLSRWFSRGWTLQELLAPSSILFYDRMGDFIGTRASLAKTISYSTGIHPLYLNKTWHIEQASVAQRMSWASRRETTRTEDIAYSLLGIFDVKMPLLYGEGNKAFYRLQLAIIEQSDDESIFAWAINEGATVPLGILATSPRLFTGSEAIVSIQSAVHTYESTIQATSKVITYRYTAKLLELVHAMVGWESDEYVHITLACKVHMLKQSHLLSLKLRRNLDDGKYYRVGVHAHRPDRLINVLCHLIAYEKVIHISPLPAPQMLHGLPQDDPRIRSVRRANYSYRQPVLLTLRGVFGAMLLFVALPPERDYDNRQINRFSQLIAAGGLILLRDILPGVFFWALFLGSGFAFVLMVSG